MLGTPKRRDDYKGATCSTPAWGSCPQGHPVQPPVFMERRLDATDANSPLRAFPSGGLLQKLLQRPQQCVPPSVQEL